jgi:hypothetical protein
VHGAQARGVEGPRVADHLESILQISFGRNLPTDKIFVKV